MADVDPDLLRILRHSLGIGNDGHSPCYRNHFVTGVGCNNHPLCVQLVALGFMTKHKGNALTGGDDLFTVTDAGRAAARPTTPNRLSRSQQRYREFLDADSGMSFGEWIRQRKPSVQEGPCLESASPSVSAGGG
uniref:hypothetical protein n=1 Tax=Xanthomonas albilineans TaxID=29447 RepID=UPI0027DBA22B|nr:hypothetical protein [Xanthomonas albilineans]